MDNPSGQHCPFLGKQHFLLSSGSSSKSAVKILLSLIFLQHMKDAQYFFPSFQASLRKQRYILLKANLGKVILNRILAFGFLTKSTISTIEYQFWVAFILSRFKQIWQKLYIYKRLVDICSTQRVFFSISQRKVQVAARIGAICKPERNWGGPG